MTEKPRVRWDRLGFLGAEEMVDFGPYRMPKTSRLELDDPARPFIVEVRVVIEENRLIADEVTFRRREGGPPLNGSDLRVPIAKMILTYAPAIAWRAAKDESDTGRGIVMKDATGARWVELGSKDGEAFYRTLFREKRPEPGKRRRVDEDRLRRVAALYRTAVANGDAPGPRIAKELFIERESARRLVAQARQRGFLGPALRGLAGEGKQDRKEKR